MSQKKIWISRDSKTYGPYDRETLFTYIASGNISWSDLDCNEGDPNYRGLRSFFAFHLTRDGKQFGPFRPLSFWKQFLKGKVAPNDSIWVEGLSSWKEAGQVFGEYYNIPKSNLKRLWQDFQPAFEDLNRIWRQIRLDSEFASIESKFKEANAGVESQSTGWSERSDSANSDKPTNAPTTEPSADWEELPSPASQDTSLALLENDEAILSGALDDELSESENDDDLSESETDDDLSEEDDDDDEN